MVVDAGVINPTKVCVTWTLQNSQPPTYNLLRLSFHPRK